MNLNNWPTAFLLTQAIEIPVYLWAARSLPRTNRWCYAAGASAIPHPIIWFCLPWETVPYVPLAIVAETFAVVVEALWGTLWEVPRPWMVSLLANAASFSAGNLIHWALVHV